MKPRQLHFKNTTYVLFTLIIAVLFFVANAIISSSAKQTRAEISRVTAENFELEAQLHELEDELNYINTLEGLETYAHAYGMSMPGEVHYSDH